MRVHVLYRLSRILRFVAIRESFLLEILGCGIIWSGKSEQSVKVFSAKIVFFINSRMFSPSKIFGYMVEIMLQW